MEQHAQHKYTEPQEISHVLTPEHVKALRLKFGSAIRAPGIAWCSECQKYTVAPRYLGILSA